MDAKLVVAGGKTSVKEIALLVGKTIVGRKNDCTLRIMSNLVSRQHCELTNEGHRVIVNDLGSSNGTFVNGIKVQSKELQAGDTLVIGPITFVVQFAGVGASPADTKRPAGVPVVAAEPVADDASGFVIEEEAGAGAAGAGQEADFVLAEEAALDEGADFVVAEEVAADVDTAQDMLLTDIIGAEEPTDMTGSPPAAESAEAPTVEPEQSKKKKGRLLGKLFQKKPKSSKSKPDPVAATPPAAQAAPAAPSPPASHPKSSPSRGADSAKSEPAEFLIEGDQPKTDKAKPSKTEKEAAMGEDDLANFLMGLNTKDE